MIIKPIIYNLQAYYLHINFFTIMNNLYYIIIYIIIYIILYSIYIYKPYIFSYSYNFLYKC